MRTPYIMTTEAAAVVPVAATARAVALRRAAVALATRLTLVEALATLYGEAGKVMVMTWAQDPILCEVRKSVLDDVVETISRNTAAKGSKDMPTA